MNKKIMLYAAALMAFLTQGCHKAQVAKTSYSEAIERSSGLTLSAVGQYGAYQFINADGGLSAEVAGLSLQNGGTGNLAAYSGTAHQKWRITNTGNGYFTIMNLGSGKVAQATPSQGTDSLVQASYSGADAQLWLLQPTAGKYYKAINKADGLSITGNGTGGTLTLTAYTGAASQTWGYNQLPPDGYRDDAVVNFFHRTNTSQGSVAFDQGSSIPLSDGRVLWIAEDSFDGNELQPDGNLKCYIFEYRNSVIIQPASHTWDPNQTPNITINSSTDGRPKQVFNIQPNTDWTWPGVGVELGNKVYVYAGEGVGLGATNQSLYQLTEDPASYVWNAVRTTPAGMSGQTTVNYSLGMVKPGDGYVYAYGGKGVFFNASSVYVARFKESDPQTWTFWTGSAWADTLNTSSAGAITTQQQNVTISYARGRYIMMVMDLGFFCDPSSHSIYLATASSSTGPFTPLVKVFTIEDMYRGHLNRYYTPMIHPEFDNGLNELLLTYSVNFAACSTGDDCANNEMGSINYQVKGVRVPYSMIGM